LGVNERVRERERACRGLLERGRGFFWDVIWDRFSLDPAGHPRVFNFGYGRGRRMTVLANRAFTIDPLLGMAFEPEGKR
jgi:hypothetical protein